MDLKHYPHDWRRVSLRIRARAQNRCECEGECGIDHLAESLVDSGGDRRCTAVHRQSHPITWSRVVLTVAHLCDCRDLEGRKCGTDSHLRAMCQRCHLTLDGPAHRARARVTRWLRKAVGDLFPEV